MIENFDYKKIFKTALKNGGQFAELFEEHSFQTLLQKEKKRFDKIYSGIDFGVGLRIIADQKTYYAFTNEVTERSLLQVATDLAECVHSSQQAALSLDFTRPIANWEKAILENPHEVNMDRKIKILEDAERSAWESGAEICQVATAYKDQNRKITVINSEGLFVQEDQIYTVFFVNATAQKDRLLQTGYEPLGGTMGFEIFDQEDPALLGASAAKRAIQSLYSPKAPQGKMMVVISSEAGGTMVHEAVGHGLEADLAREGLSVYKDKIGQNVASPLISVIDDPTLAGKRGSFLFDDEGHPGQKNILIENGELKTYMYNSLYSQKEHRASTGNGRRQSYQYQPLVRMTNTYIAPGKSNPEDIIRSVDRGLFVKKMGGGQVNTVNGEFVFDCTEAYRIENGEIADSVRGATLTGSGMDVLKSIDMVGTDLGFSLGTCGKCGQGVPVGDAQPTLRIPEMTVGGSEA